jgi:diguanylate cyclase (GGDEF)-like protein
MSSLHRVYLCMAEPIRADAIQGELTRRGIECVPLVTESETAPDPAALVCGSEQAFRGLPEHLRGQTAGIVAVGWTGPGAANLPADATPREIAIACELVIEIVRLKRDCENQRQQRSVLDDLAHTDPLTGLANRLAWQKELARCWRASRKTGSRLCLAIVDLDRFKETNDAVGHAIGDAVLKAAASGLATAIRGDDFVARLGGDEFGLLLHGVERELAGAVVERIRNRVATATEKQGRLVTASAGCAMADSNSASSETFERADGALRSAKQAGRNRTKAAE